MSGFSRRAASVAIAIAVIGMVEPAFAQRRTTDPAGDIPPSRSFSTVPDMPAGRGSFNPTGPRPFTSPDVIQPMPPGGRGSFNPTGPLPGAPQGYVHPMPPGGAGSYTPGGPTPQPYLNAPSSSTAGGVQSPRLPLRLSPRRADIEPGYEPCVKGYKPKRGFTREQHIALCERIWVRGRPES